MVRITLKGASSSRPRDLSWMNATQLADIIEPELAHALNRGGIAQLRITATMYDGSEEDCSMLPLVGHAPLNRLGQLSYEHLVRVMRQLLVATDDIVQAIEMEVV